MVKQVAGTATYKELENAPIKPSARCETSIVPVSVCVKSTKLRVRLAVVASE